MNIKNFKHKTKIIVRFSDLDAMQHVNNATYLTYLEETRIDYFNTLFSRKKIDSILKQSLDELKLIIFFQSNSVMR